MQATTGGPQQAPQSAADVTDAAVAEEWARRAGRTGLARVMRASQPTRLNSRVTEQTRHLVTGYLRRASAERLDRS